MRLKEPKVAGNAASWSTVDSKLKSSIAEAKAKAGQVVFLTNTLASPSTEKLIAEFIAKNPNAKHVVYDAVSSSEALDAFQTVYGKRALVDYDFSKASLIVRVSGSGLFSEVVTTQLFLVSTLSLEIAKSVLLSSKFFVFFFPSSSSMLLFEFGLNPFSNKNSNALLIALK